MAILPAWLFASELPGDFDEFAIVSIELNKVSLGESQILVRKHDLAAEYFVDTELADRMRLIWKKRSVITISDIDFISIASLSGASASLDPGTQTLKLTIPPSLLKESQITQYSERKRPLTTPVWAGHLNYDLFAYDDSRSSSYVSGRVELGLSGPYGTGLLTATANNASSSHYGVNRRVTRLDTSWQYDDIDTLRSLVVGDIISQSSTTMPGGGLRLGGIRYGTQYTLRPDLITQPLQSVGGLAVIPSTIDLYVNNNRIGSHSVEAGPFTINDIPVISGGGEITVVVRDQFGQEQLITSPFYSSVSLLRPGFSDWSVSAGFLRENYGIADFDYGNAYASGSYRLGVSSGLTSEVAFEATPGNYSAGISTNRLMLGGIVLSSLTANRSDRGHGLYGTLGYEFRGRSWSVMARSTWVDEAVSLLTWRDDYSLKNRHLLSGGVSLGKAGSIGLTLFSEQIRNEAPFKNISLSYSVSLFKHASLSFSLSRSHSDSDHTSFFTTFTMPLGNSVAGGMRPTFSSSISDLSDGHGKHYRAASASLQKGFGAGEGFGYRLEASDPGNYRIDSTYSGPYGTYQIGLASGRNSSGTRASVSGGIGLIDGETFASRRITDSFGIVKVPDSPNVKVYRSNNLLGKTDGKGRLLIPNLMPYNENKISIDVNDLPISSNVADDVIVIVPRYRSGSVITFSVNNEQNVVAIVHDHEGNPVPIGAHLVDTDGQKHPFGKDGQVFITSVTAGKTLRVSGPGTDCAVVLEYESSKEDIPLVGPFVCKPFERIL